jgi:hypothetical protein
MRVNETCQKCRFFVKFEPDGVAQEPRRGGNGHCHRHAPEPLAGGSGTGWADFEWPSVKDTEFCGEFKGRF